MSFARNKFYKISILLIVVLIFFSGCNINNETITQNTANSQTDNNDNKNQELFSHFSEVDIDSDNIMAIIEELSSKKYNGRLTGTVGNKLTQEYIIDFYKDIGLEEPEGLDNYKQIYQQEVLFNNSRPILETVDENGNIINSYEYAYEFSYAIGGINRINYEVSAPVLYIDSIDKLYVGNNELNGKVLLIPEEIIAEMNNQYNRGDLSLYNWINSEESGIEGAICEVSLPAPGTQRDYFNISVVPDFIDRTDETKGQLIAICSTRVFNEIKRTASEGALVHLKADYSVEEVDAANIIGVIPAKAESSNKEYIIISAHFDHVGDNKDGTYNPGALDNASGVAVMMEVARVLSEAKEENDKTIVFIAFDGEETGLKGSEYYANNPIFPLENSKNINFDMIGAKSNTPIYILDSQLVENKLKDTLLKYSRDLLIGCQKGKSSRGDHASFNLKGIESISIIQPDEVNGYHSPGDTIESISPGIVKSITKLVLYYLDKNAY